MHGGAFNQEKSVIFRQFASVAGCMRNFKAQSWTKRSGSPTQCQFHLQKSLHFE